jgi:hypothetical protein
LAKQLGFELPATEEQRRKFWTTLSQQLIYGRDPEGKTPFRVEEWKPSEPKKSKTSARPQGENDKPEKEEHSEIRKDEPEANFDHADDSD